VRVDGPFLLLVAGLAALPSVLRAQQQPAASDLSALEQSSGAPLRVTRSRLTGLPTHIAAQAGQPIRLPVPRSATATARAAAFVDLAAGALGLTSAKDVEPLDARGPMRSAWSTSATVKPTSGSRWRPPS
jgi:hypothetical protein